MTERTKLTEDDIGFDYDDNNGLCVGCYLEEFEQLKQQILEDQKKAEKIDKITAFAKTLTYSNPHVSWQLKQLLKDLK